MHIFVFLHALGNFFPTLKCNGALSFFFQLGISLKVQKGCSHVATAILGSYSHVSLRFFPYFRHIGQAFPVDSAASTGISWSHVQVCEHFSRSFADAQFPDAWLKVTLVRPRTRRVVLITRIMTKDTLA